MATDPWAGARLSAGAVDAQSFTDDDLIATDLVYHHVLGETSSVEYNPRHRWYR
jgi:hypothetical protein